TTHAGRGNEDSPQARAIALLLRDHLGSDKLDYACWRTSYGFHKDCERFLRTALDKSPHKGVQGTACFRLAQFLKARLHRLDLLKERPEMARRYESLFGKDYLVTLQRQDPAKAGAEVEALFERVIEKYPDVKLPYSGTVGEQAKRELYEIRHLSVGKQAQEIEGEDQDGKRFKLSDYRGKVVLLYFWSESCLPDRRAGPTARAPVKDLEKHPSPLGGVNDTSPDAKNLKPVMKKENHNWRSFAAGRPISEKGTAPPPGSYLIDPKGVIRH